MRQDGIGTKYFVSTNERYEGQWTKGQMTGFGKFYLFTEDEKTYTGQFYQGVMNGDGVIKTKNYIYKGYIKNGVANGFGCYEDLKTEVVYEGNFSMGKREGFGKEYNGENGYYMSEYEGFWLKDTRDGEGKLKRQKSPSQHIELIEGRWEQDVLKEINRCTTLTQMSDFEQFQEANPFSALIQQAKDQQDILVSNTRSNKEDEKKLQDQCQKMGLKVQKPIYEGDYIL